MYQIQHFSVVSKDILQVRFLVFCLKPLCNFVPHDHWTSTSDNIRHFPQRTEKPKTNSEITSFDKGEINYVFFKTNKLEILNFELIFTRHV